MKRLRVELEFGRSSSPRYRVAARLAAQFPSFRSTGTGRSERNAVRVDVDFRNRAQWGQLSQLITQVRGWKSTRLKVDGADTEFWSFERGISEVRRCYETRVNRGASDDHCIGKPAPDSERAFFGCTLEKGVRLASTYSYRREPMWFNFGNLSDDNGVFRVDKRAILARLRAENAGQFCTRCPAWEWARVKAGIATLPNSIAISDTGLFELKFSELDRRKPLGIKPRHDAGGRAGILIRLGRDDDDADDQVVRDVPPTRYKDVAGQDDAIREVRNVIELPLVHPEYFEELGVASHQGVLLYGPPGNGKTLIVKAVAGESDSHLEIINGPEILSKWVGESESNLRRVFARAAELQPSIVLIDEIDALAGDRDSMHQQHEITLISQLLVLLDGLKSRGRVAVVATTNRIEAIDAAIRRPGRFDYHIEVKQPDARGRRDILAVHLAKMKKSKDVNIQSLADRTEGFSGADIAALCREAGLLAITTALSLGIPKDKVRISHHQMLAAVERIAQKRLQSEGVR